MEQDHHPSQSDQQSSQSSPERKHGLDERCIAGSKVLIVRNYLTKEHPPPKQPERCLIQRVVSKETLLLTPTEALPVLEQQPKTLRRSSLNAKVGLTLTAAVAAVGLWWYTRE